ncbi:MAG: hypothetical protein MUC65_01165 [Pontiellaceae bacterium]|nr:hypothetical protein [Pontiellaceae bacterium]
MKYGDSGTALTNDFDGDGMINLYEYALNGAMQSAGIKGTDPAFARDATNSFLYTFVRRTNDTSVVYNIQTRTNLLSGDWANATFTLLSTNKVAENFIEYKYRAPTATSNLCIRLKISMPTPPL